MDWQSFTLLQNWHGGRRGLRDVTKIPAEAGTEHNNLYSKVGEITENQRDRYQQLLPAGEG